MPMPLAGVSAVHPNSDYQPAMRSQIREPRLSASPPITRAAGFTPPMDSVDNELTSGWIEFSLPTSAGIVIPVMIAGLSVLALVDTGASMSAIDAAIAARLQLPFQGDQVIQTDLGRTTVRTVRCPPLRVGRSSLSINGVLATSLFHLSETLGVEIAIILGQDAFDSRLLTLDMPNRKLALRERGISPAAFGYQRTALYRGPNGRRCVQVTVEGAEIPAVFDLGNSNAIMMSRAFASSRQLLQGRRLSSAATRTLSGIEISTTFRTSNVSIADYNVGEAPAEAFDQWTCEQIPANVGLPLFHDFKMVVDLAGDSLWLYRAKGRNTPLRVDRSGLGLALRANFLRVMHVAAGSPAEAAGWQVGSEIHAVDGYLVGADYFKSGLSDWRYGEVGRQVRLMANDRCSRELILQDYI